MKRFERKYMRFMKRQGREALARKRAAFDRETKRETDDRRGWDENGPSWLASALWLM